MDSHRWQQVEAIFETALELAPEEREAYVRLACGDDAELFAECMSLLAQDEHPHSLLAGEASHALGLLDELAYDGSQIGAYKVIRKIGEGGMGLVFLAERADGQFAREVALKVIKRGMDSESILRRFQIERQIQARLTHPNIARLYDGGLTDDGLPYFTMEYIEGEPIDSYCDGHRLPVDERLRLFLTVCRAVAYAQQNLVVHRDLKPSNILITSDGTAKLLDFGIAKVLDQDNDQPHPVDLTRTGVRPLTPGYASPEQFRGEAITTATDVYSLGVVLYELLTGRRPFDLSALNPLAIQRAVTTTDPGKPSSVIMRPIGGASGPEAVTPEVVSSQRGTLPDRLRRRLAGDIDTICLKALRTDPANRYASVELFAGDIRRHLEGKPITARPDSLGYRTRKFVQRHKTSVTAALLAVITIGALVTYYTVKLAHERDKARREAEKSAQVSAFSTSLFAMFDPVETNGQDVTIRTLLENGINRIDSELHTQPEVQARMYDVVGNVYYSLGGYDTAGMLFERAYQNRLATLAEDSTDLAVSFRNLSLIAYEQGELDSSAALTRQAMAITIADSGAFSIAAANDYHELASALRHNGEYTEARELYEKALAIREQILGSEDPDVAYTLNHLSRLYQALGNLDSAETLARRALGIREKAFGKDNPEVAASRSSLAGMLVRQGRAKEAARLYEIARQSFLKVFGEEHPYTAGVTGSLAATYLRLGELARADSLAREGVRLVRAIFPPGHPNLAINLNIFGNVLFAEGKLTESETAYRECLAIRRELLPESHLMTAGVCADLAECLLMQKKYSEVEGLLLAAFRAFDDNVGDKDPRTLRVIDLLVDYYAKVDKPEEAERFRSLRSAAAAPSDSSGN
jgi:serine/threonine-protein kinase